MIETYMFYVSERDALTFLATMGALFSGAHGDSHAGGIYSGAMKDLFGWREYRGEDLPEPDWTPDTDETPEPREDKKRDRERRSERRSKRMGWM